MRDDCGSATRSRLEATVREALPNALYRVELETGSAARW